MESTHCLRCNRPLKDPHSIALGIGPECRMKQKQEGSRGPTLDLFGGCKYYSHTEQEVLIIIDMGQGGRSVTDDIENVLIELKAEIKALPNPIIIYRDQLEIYDGVRLDEHGQFQEYYPLNTQDRAKAIKKAKQKAQKGKNNG